MVIHWKLNGFDFFIRSWCPSFRKRKELSKTHLQGMQFNPVPFHHQMECGASCRRRSVLEIFTGQKHIRLPYSDVNLRDPNQSTCWNNWHKSMWTREGGNWILWKPLPPNLPLPGSNPTLFSASIIICFHHFHPYLSVIWKIHEEFMEEEDSCVNCQKPWKAAPYVIQGRSH